MTSLLNASRWYIPRFHWLRLVLTMLLSASLIPSLRAVPQVAAAGGKWNTIASSMFTDRSQHMATLLPDGRILVVGGRNTGGNLSSAELYNPQTNTWSSAGITTTTRGGHTATLLADGRVLIVGGSSQRNTGTEYLSSAELYNPLTNTWSSASSLTTARFHHTATLLADGRVLVVGGYDGSNSEVYNPQTNTWSSTGSLTSARYNHTATLLADGRVLVVGGYDGSRYLSNAELYNPQTNTWSNTEGLTTARSDHTATLLADGRVLIAGGYDGSNALSSVEIYDPQTNTWSSAGSLTAARSGHTATLLTDGRVLVVGNRSIIEDNAELYDAQTNTWNRTGRLTTYRRSHTATLLADGRVLIAGGNNGKISLSRAEVYDPQTNSWDSSVGLTTARYDHTATLLADGRVLVIGRRTSIASDTLSSSEEYDVQTNAWSNVGNMADTRTSHTATLLADGRVLVVGGYSYNRYNGGGSILSSATVYDSRASIRTIARPQITNITPQLNQGGVIQVIGSGFRGILEGYSEGSGGTTQNSATNFPLLRLYSLTTGQIQFVPFDSKIGWSNSSFTSLPLTDFPSGYTLVTIIANGIPSVSKVIRVNFPPRIAAIANQRITAGTNVTLGPLPIFLGDAETFADTLTVTASSSNSGLVPNTSIAVGGTNAIRTLTINPVAYQTGTTTITLTVQDAENARTSTSFVLTVLPPTPPWLVMLYLSGDDIAPPSPDGLKVSLNESIKELRSRLEQMPDNPAMRLVVLYDGNQPNDSQLLVHIRGHLEEVIPRPAWFPANDELDMGSTSTLRDFITWAKDTSPDAQHTFLSIVDHGGGWAPDFSDDPGQRRGRGVQAGGWRGVSMDVGSGVTSLSTKNTREALQGFSLDVVFFDACLMGMIESVHEVRSDANYVIAGENLLWAQLPYDQYLAPDVLTVATTPRELAQMVVARYNKPDPTSTMPEPVQPFTIAALDTSRLPSLQASTDALAAQLLAALPPAPVPLDNPVRLALTRAYNATQKFDYDVSLTIDSTEGYVDLADFARNLRDSSDPTITQAIRTAADEVFQAVAGPEASRAVVATRAISGTAKGASQPWNFAGAYGLSIYLPLGEQDCRPTGAPGTATSPELACNSSEPVQVQGYGTERQLAYYADPNQLTFTRDVPNWAKLLLRLEANTPPRHLDARPFQSAFPLQDLSQRTYLPFVMRLQVAPSIR